MTTVGIRALKQNASAVIAQVERGETVVVTDRGRRVAQIVPLRSSRLDELLASGEARPARSDLRDLGLPEVPGDLSSEVLAARDDDRY
ncbi:type II toxin-antitoxin system Phd/YefM family antitoxin [Luteimicrobium sp. DT211]|uniref:type II toxin-antitoxin system Phd/YefM family antitoxin n=1 Tax=Luteimicrobium sp. DT211 TaxID=3393412 RepID=UPI003CEF5643